MLTKKQLNILRQAANRAGWKFRLASDVREKALETAIDSFAPEARQEDVYAFFSTALFGNKTGYLLTSKGLYNDKFSLVGKYCCGRNRIALEGIVSVEPFTGRESVYVVDYRDGFRQLIYSPPTYLNGLMALLNAVIRLDTEAASEPSKAGERAPVSQPKSAEPARPTAGKPVSAKSNPKPVKTDNSQLEELLKQGRAAYESHHFTEALSLMERVARTGNVEAQLYCACMYLNCEGISEEDASKPKNQKKMLEWFEAAAEDGNSIAQYTCGYLYTQGIGAKQDMEKALHWMRAAADNGYAKAYPICGYLYETGVNRCVDYEEAIRWYEKAEQAGEQGGPAVRSSMKRWKEAKQLAAGNLEEATAYFRHDSDSKMCVTEHGREHFFAGAYDKAYPFLSYAAHDGWREAQFLLGRMYAEGLGVEKNPGKAKACFDRLNGGALKERYTIMFGTYPQGKNGEIEPIEWFVLDRKGDDLLLFSRNALEVKKYHNTLQAIQWADCDLRKWMNGEFFNKAFSDADKRWIHLTKLDNSRNKRCRTAGGPDTEDRVFLLSLPEAVQYFCYEGTKAGKTTTGMPYYNSDDRNVTTCFAANRLNLNLLPRCWLRSSGKTEKQAAIFCMTMFPDGEDVNENLGVRPAVWLHLGAFGK